jgi:hypothetical protein
MSGKLCDLIQEQRAVPFARQGAFQSFKEHVRVAKKFVLDETFALSADVVAQQASQIEKVLPFCAAPFQNVWIECKHSHRPTFHTQKALSQSKDSDAVPERIGFLLKATDAGSWIASMAWNAVHESEVRLCSAIISHGSLSTALQNGLQVMQADNPIFDYSPLTKLGGPNAIQLIRDEATRDWKGEVQFLFAAIGLLNSRNFAEFEEVDNTKLSAVRAKRGKPPRSSYVVCKIQRRFAMPVSGHNHETAELRAHLVRGHFKRKRRGVYWWSPHMRGSVRSGFVDKEYRVI